MLVLIGGLQKSSLIDYPEKISAIIFTQGCNFRCPYCHNPELIEGTENGEQETAESVFRFLKSRIGKLDGVVITGGEPTLHKDLPEFIKKIKDLGFALKLDTNGTNPQMLQELIDTNLIDYIAMDIKAPLDKYSEVVCASVDTKKIQQSIDILKNSNIDYEFRTTVVKSQLTRADFEKIGALLKERRSARKYYLQRFLPTKTLNRFFINRSTYSDEEFEDIKVILNKYLADVEVR